MTLDAPPHARPTPSAADPATPARPPRRGQRRRLLRLAALVVAIVVTGVSGFGVVWVVTPSVASAPSRVAAILAAHHALSDDGVIPAKVAAAVLATEDSRFYADPALDPAGTVRAGWGLLSDNPDEGGATIEMQLAKLLYTGGHSGSADQVEQVVLAFNLDEHYPKTQILAMYLDAAYFGDRVYGITAAARHYFGLLPGQLSWGQAALLAGLLQAPSAYNPHRHLVAALARQEEVLGRLVAVGTLTRSQAEQIAATPLHPAIAFRG